MIVYRVLKVAGKDLQNTIEFGEADSDEEKADIFRLRYEVYSCRGYIDPSRYPDSVELDSYDTDNKCKYFIAKIGTRIIGCIRLIRDDPLPTEQYFTFSEPEKIRSIPRNRRCELGRFIIIPLDKIKNRFLPRGLIMLFMFDTVLNYAIRNGIEGGYSFVKSSLERKMKILMVPVNIISQYLCKYPQNGVLVNYFSQVNDPVIPIYFVADEFYRFTERRIHSSMMFQKEDDTTVILKLNLYTRFLKSLKII